MYKASCAGCHTLTGHDTHAPGGDLADPHLAVADLESFTRAMPIRPPLTRAETIAVSLYVRNVSVALAPHR